VICDRFTDSTRAYQGYGRGVPMARIDEVDRLATGGRVPDRTLLFDLPAELARSRGHSPARVRRGAADRLDAEGLAFYQRVRDGFLELARRDSERFRIVDSSGDATATQAAVLAVLEEWLG
jgi:dTMP kinase